MNDFNILDELIAEGEAKWLFFDEIQIVQGWEMYVRQKLDEGYCVIITGSNASLLSRELGTKLTGRHITKELFPFSFDEFCSYRAVPSDADALVAYLKLGGFPGFLAHENVDIHSALLDDIVYRDIAVRHNIRDVQSLKRLLVFLATNCAKLISASKLKQYLAVKSTTTVLEYLTFFEESYLIQLVPKFSYALKVQLVNPRKVYFIDNGLQQTITASFNEDLGRRLENAVFWELRRRGKTVYYFTESGKECDFVVCQGERVEQVIQVCAVLDAENEKREIDGLLEAMSFFGLTEGSMITLNQVDRLAVGNFRVNVVPAFTFFGARG
jgi:predicted AAA+ superfamily ATPase